MLHLTPTVFVWLAEYYLFFASQYNYYRGTERNFTYIQRRSASKQGTTTLYAHSATLATKASVAANQPRLLPSKGVSYVRS